MLVREFPVHGDDTIEDIVEFIERDIHPISNADLHRFAVKIWSWINHEGEETDVNIKT